VSYNVPPYGRAGLYLELANLKDLVEEYRQRRVTDELKESSKDDLKCTIWSSVQKSGMMKDVPLYLDPSKKDSLVEGTDLPGSLPTPVFNDWVANLSNYLVDLQTRLFSCGLHVLGVSPSDDELLSYIEAYFGEKLHPYDPSEIISDWRKQKKGNNGIAENQLASFLRSAGKFFGFVDDAAVQQPSVQNDANEILDLLSSTTEEMDNLISGLDGGFIPAAPGGDLLRDGPAVLPTGRNIHALDPYRMPSAGAWARGQRIATELIRTHQEANAGQYPETIAVTLWGLDAIKTRGESVAIALSLVGAEPVKEGTGRIVRFDLIPLQRLGRPRIDVLASLSGIFR
jgi:magnesium chelatase subunit H